METPVCTTNARERDFSLEIRDDDHSRDLRRALRTVEEKIPEFPMMRSTLPSRNRERRS